MQMPAPEQRVPRGRHSRLEVEMLSSIAWVRKVFEDFGFASQAVFDCHAFHEGTVNALLKPLRDGSIFSSTMVLDNAWFLQRAFLHERNSTLGSFGELVLRCN